MSKEEYKGEYKIEMSDEGRVSFNLNIKYVIGILITLFGFIGYLLVDEYIIEPDQEKTLKIELLEKASKEKDEILDQVISNQQILLDRSERTEIFMREYLESHNNHQDAPVINNSSAPQ